MRGAPAGPVGRATLDPMRITRRVRFWLILSAAAALVVGSALVALPEVLRRVAASKPGGVLGRPVAIEDVDPNLFTGRMAVTVFAVGGRGGVGLGPLTADLQVALRDGDLGLILPYLPPDPPVRLQRGRLNAALHVRSDAPGTARLDGHGIVVEDLALLRRGPPGPFVSVPLLGFTLTNVGLARGGLSAAEVTLAGEPIIVDAAPSPPQRFELTQFRLALADAAWPGGRPARVEVAATLAGGDALRADGTIALGPLGADLRVDLDRVDLARLRPYLPPDPPLTLREGLLLGTVMLRHEDRAGTRLQGDLALQDLVLLRRGQLEPFASAPRLTVSLRDVALRGGALAAEHIEVQGRATILDGSLTPPQHPEVESLRLALVAVTWPATAPTRVQLALGLPEGGTITADGTLELAARTADLRLVADSLPLAPYRRYAPLAAPIAGTVEADLGIVGSFAGPLEFTARGTARVAGFALGPPERPPVTVKDAEPTDPDRLVAAEAPAAPGGPGEGRIEFEIRPAA